MGRWHVCVLLLALAVYARGDCPAATGWFQFGPSCYFLATYTTTPKGNNTWNEANQLCVTMNAQLVSVNSVKELNYILLFLNKANGPVWIGLNDRQVEGTYVWPDGTSPSQYANWASGEPNNVGDEDCVQMDSHGMWNDVNCAIAQNFMCEKPISAATPSATAPKNYTLVNTTNCGGWYLYSGFCYQYFSSSLTWTQAESKCFQQGATLLTILNANELAYIKSFIYQKRTRTFYLALNDRLNEGQFVWDDPHNVNGIPLGSVTAWGSGEPNDARHSEDCTEFQSYPALKWNDIPCRLRRPYMCKRQANSSGVFPAIKRTQRSSCPNGWTQYNHPSGAKYCYHLYGASYRQRTTWYGARTACRRSGTGFDLVSIHDHYEMGKIGAMIAQQKYSAYTYWIGLNDASKEGGYVWSDGSPTDYVKWARNQPNNLGGRQDCTEYYRYSGQWNDNRCTYRQAYICKYTLVPRPTPGGTPTITSKYCLKGWLQFGSYCYFLAGSTLVTHAQAVAACNGMGKANLTSINSASEQAFLMANLGAQNASVRVHIGINDIKIEGEFTWVDKSLVTYTNWGYQQPNDLGHKQDCTELSHTLGYWNDINCNAKRGYICKRLRDQSTQPPQQQSNLCKAGYQHFKSYCYMASPTKLNFNTAEAACSNVQNSFGLSGHLATVRSRYDNFFLTSLVTTPSMATQRYYWIGLNDIVTEGMYTWKSGLPITYANWGRGQPNDWRHGQDCAEFWTSSGQWNDYNCSASLPYICMMPDENTKTLPPPPTPPSGTAAPCTNGWLKHGTICYGFFGTINTFTMQQPTTIQPMIKPLVWTDAAASCASMGATLVSIHSNDTLNFLITTASASKGGWSRFWSGLNDRSEEGGYTWQDGTPVGFSSWALGQPNDWQGAQDCVEVIVTGRYSYLWNDQSCGAQRPYICEVPAGKAITMPTVAPIVPPQGMKLNPCPNGWTASSTMCYQVNELGKGRSFTSAELKCKSSMGSLQPGQPMPHLASIHSPQEHIFMASFLQTFLANHNFNKSTTFWIGLNDRTVEGNYSWTDNSTINYFGWAQGQPNNWRGTQDCTEMRMDLGFLWNDAACSNTMPYVCGFSRLAPTNAPTPTPPSAISKLNCAPGWLKMGASCYKEFTSPRLSWENAFLNCTNRGGELLIVNNKEEQYFVTSKVIQNQEYVWIGLSDIDRESYWRWSDGTRLNYARWGPGQPNNYANQDCGAIHGSDSKWYDRDCDEPHSYVCELPVTSMNYTAPSTSHKLGKGAVAGIGIVGAVVVVIIIGVVIFFIRRQGIGRGGGNRSTTGFQPLTSEPINTAEDDDEKLLTAE